MAAETHRLFFALWPDEGLRKQLAGTAQFLRERCHPAGRWTAPERYHLTLQFLGGYPQFPEAVVRLARQAAQQVSAPPFEMRVDQAHSFASRTAPWVLGASAVPAELRQLVRNLREMLRRQRVPHETGQRFVPHVTVLRDARQTLPPMPLPAVVWRADHFVLAHSQSGAAGYAVLDRWPLQALPGGARPGAVQRDLWET